MATLQEYDIVRVIRLLSNDRPYDGTEGIQRAPRIGDVATIVHDYAGDSTAALIVEMSNDEGYTVWLADFDRQELEFVSRLDSII